MQQMLYVIFDFTLYDILKMKIVHSQIIKRYERQQ